jgi:hypothetical protein
MLRARLAVVLLAGSLGLTTGCSSLRNHPWFSNNRACGPECIDLGVTSVSEGPILEGGGPIMAPLPPAGVPGTPLPAQPPIPQLNIPPRLEPVPQTMAPPSQYKPVVR